MTTVTSERAITATVRDFCAMTGLGVTKTYELLGSGEIESFKIGKRRLIVLDSYHRLIERQRAKAA